MSTMIEKIDLPRVLVIGDDKIAKNFHDYLVVLKHPSTLCRIGKCEIPDGDYDLITLFLKDSFIEKNEVIKKLNQSFGDKALLATTLDSTALSVVQEFSGSLIMGLNVSFPVKASPFMEIIKTKKNTQRQIDHLMHIGRECWQLDPYVCDNVSVRAYMLAAMAREALSLVDNGYADAESIDRACRNDAGYYLPFAGNYLYMDLMGTMAYSLVMKDLNPELSKDAEVPKWLLEKVQSGYEGMETNEGLYKYKEGDLQAWDTIVKEFAEDIRLLINRYRKDYREN